MFQPPRRSAFGASAATIVTVIGGALAAFAVIKWLDAGDNADRIEGAFQQIADAGQIPQAFDVTTGPGFIVVIAGSLLIFIGGLLGFRRGGEIVQVDEAASPDTGETPAV